MAFLRLNPKNLHLDVLVGVNEQYKPTREIKALVKKVDKLINETKTYLQDNYGTTDVNEVAKAIRGDKKKVDDWKKFIDKKYKKPFTEIIDKIEVINKKLCNNYEEFSEKVLEDAKKKQQS